RKNLILDAHEQVASRSCHWSHTLNGRDLPPMQRSYLQSKPIFKACLTVGGRIEFHRLVQVFIVDLAANRVAALDRNEQVPDDFILDASAHVEIPICAEGL